MEETLMTANMHFAKSQGKQSKISHFVCINEKNKTKQTDKQTKKTCFVSPNKGIIIATDDKGTLQKVNEYF